MVTIKTMSAALAALLISGGVAAAASTTTDLNMRSGPGPEYQVVGVIPSGAPVDVLGCSGSWCQVNYAGRAGFASASYLSGDARGAAMVPSAPAYGPTYGYVDRGYSPYASYGYSPYESYGYDNSYDNNAYGAYDEDDGYAFAPSYQGWSGGYQGWAGGHNDW